MVGQVHATNFAQDAIEFLKSGDWTQNGQISLDNLHLFLEFTSYVNYLTPQERRIASTIPLKPTDSLLTFGMKINAKMQEMSASVCVTNFE